MECVEFDVDRGHLGIGDTDAFRVASMSQVTTRPVLVVVAAMSWRMTWW
jgi:hypothetical protein